VCLGVPGRVLRVDGLVARVDFFGVEREVRLDVVDEPVAPGDHVLNHVGFAIRRIPDEEVEATIALYDEIIATAGRDDLLRGDVEDEIGPRPGAATGAAEATGAPGGATADAPAAPDATHRTHGPDGRDGRDGRNGNGRG